MQRLINIDNGGTLTDICEWDGEDFRFTKTLTTPFDLSQCLFEGMAKVSEDVFGARDLEALLHSTQHIRYSTTQGTNALVERKGPALGLITDVAGVVDELRTTGDEAHLFDDLVGGRVAVIDVGQDEEDLEQAVVGEVNVLTTAGAARIVVSMADPEAERRLRAVLLRKFPRHLLGSVPFLFAWEFSMDRSRRRRVWSSLVNSFLHPTMERFLYNAEARLREHRVQNPLLVYRNDGASSRVAKSVALKTYSSGPRGGLEGTRALAAAYGLERVLMIDVGGTTTDVGVVAEAEVATDRRGAIAGVPISFPMSRVHSAGVGGSSIIQVVDGEIQVGPESVGAAPGPACFGFGGTNATITDVNLLLGVLDPETYLDGEFSLDAERARAVVEETVARPLGIAVEEALVRMEAAYFAVMARSFADLVLDPTTTTVAAFGGGGPMSACGAARLNGVRRVLVPRLAAVFSAFGISFSDIGRSYEQLLAAGEAPAAAEEALLRRAERDMFQEGHALADCRQAWTWEVEDSAGNAVSVVERQPGGGLPSIDEGQHLTLRLDVSAQLPHAELPPIQQVAGHPARSGGTRRLRSAADRVDEVPVYVLTDQEPGATASGPAIVEGPFFTARVLEGWSLEVTSNGDLLMTGDS